MKKQTWRITCSECGTKTESYGEYIKHILEEHPEKPSLRFSIKTEKETNP